MSKQHPNRERVANELAGASSFFKGPVQEVRFPPPPTPELDVAAIVPPATSAPAEHAAPAARTPRTGVLPVRPPTKRQMIRHPFELYLDQLEQLRGLADAQRRRGDPGSMSRMVREAIDRFLDESASDR